MELERVGRYLAGQVVLVTGAGGSIGSELCRQISRVSPRRLVLVDHAEDSMFAIQRELEDERHVHRRCSRRCSPTARRRSGCARCFAEERPQIIFHAAAYKHVGLMERNPVEAIRNNAIGTRVVARVAGAARRSARSCSISTDKAVSPATVMGASKALAECARRRCAQRRFPATRFMAVRFGNVLGSSGSVVPIFRRQIAAGGPVTVTDARMTRYFMTIPEAVQLVIRAGSLGARRRGVRARHGRAGRDHRPRAADDRALGPRARARHRDRASSARAPARSSTRSSSTRSSARSRPPAEKILLAAARPDGHARGSRRSSTRSRCSCSRPTRRALAEKVAQLIAMRVQAPVGVRGLIDCRRRWSSRSALSSGGIKTSAPTPDSPR